jgi:ribosomal protein S18 acetylase RimI-like enzyme
MDGIEIKQISTNQLDDFINLFVTILKTDFKKWTKESKDFWIKEQYTKEYWKNSIEKNHYPILVAFEKEKMIGYILLESIDFGVGYLSWLGVLTECRRRGIGRMLMQSIEEWCKENGLHKIELDTQDKELFPFYKRFGYIQEGTKKDSWQHLDNYMFGKVLE